MRIVSVAFEPTSMLSSVVPSATVTSFIETS
jgi:hypothetical protein